MAAADLTTVANLKQWLNISTTTDDALLARLVTACSTAIQNYLNRQFASASYTDNIDGEATNAIILGNYPVTAVASLTIDGIAIPSSTGTGVPGFVWDMYGVQLVPGLYQFTRGNGNITVSYTAGYAAIPLDLEQACIEFAALRYKERARIGIASQTLAGETVTYLNAAMPASVVSYLQQFKKVVPV